MPAQNANIYKKDQGIDKIQEKKQNKAIVLNFDFSIILKTFSLLKCVLSGEFQLT